MRHRVGRLDRPKETTVTVASKFLRRDPAEVRPWAETCGQIRPLIEAADGAAAEVHYVEIEAAKLHFHEHTDEVYYITPGAARWSSTTTRSRCTRGWSFTSRGGPGTRRWEGSPS